MPTHEISRGKRHHTELMEKRLDILERTVNIMAKEQARLTSHSSWFEKMIGYVLREMGYKLPKLGEKVVSGSKTIADSQQV